MGRAKVPDFRRKGNELQFKFTEEVVDKLEVVEEELDRVHEEDLHKTARSPFKKAKEALQEGKALLDNRQKLILLADRSEHGWDVVKEYVADDLAEDSDDEKKIHKAEKAAEKAAEKRLASKKKVFKGGKRPVYQPYPYPRDFRPSFPLFGQRATEPFSPQVVFQRGTPDKWAPVTIVAILAT